MEKTSKELALAGVMTALLTVVNMLSINIIYPLFVLSFIATVSVVAGIILKPYTAFLCGFLGDFLAYLINNSLTGAYNILIGLSSSLLCFIPSLLFFVYRRVIKNKNLIKACMVILISFILTFFICTAFLNTFGLWIMYAKGKKAFFTYLFARVPYQLIVCGINCVLSCLITCVLNRISVFNKLFNIENFEYIKE